MLSKAALQEMQSEMFADCDSLGTESQNTFQHVLPFSPFMSSSRDQCITSYFPFKSKIYCYSKIQNQDLVSVVFSHMGITEWRSQIKRDAVSPFHTLQAVQLQKFSLDSIEEIRKSSHQPNFHFRMSTFKLYETAYF